MQEEIAARVYGVNDNEEIILNTILEVWERTVLASGGTVLLTRIALSNYISGTGLSVSKADLDLTGSGL